MIVRTIFVVLHDSWFCVFLFSQFSADQRVKHENARGHLAGIGMTNLRSKLVFVYCDELIELCIRNSTVLRQHTGETILPSVSRG